jgi:hypothetical protein
MLHDETHESLSNEDACSQIAFRIVETAEQIDQLLVLTLRKDGSGRSMDNGLTADEAKNLVMSFHSWVDQSLGRDMERS